MSTRNLKDSIVWPKEGFQNSAEGICKWASGTLRNKRLGLRNLKEYVSGPKESEGKHRWTEGI